jgi:hypothetical protein
MLFITNFEYYCCFSLDAVKYCKKKTRKAWNIESTVRAVNAARGKVMGLLRASKIFCVPRAPLRDYVNNRDKDAEALVTMRTRRKPALPAQIKNYLLNYCLLMEINFFGLTTKYVKRIAFQFAIRNNLRHTFSTEEGKAGKKWLQNIFGKASNTVVKETSTYSCCLNQGV